MKGLHLKNEVKATVAETVENFKEAVGATLGPNGAYAIISNGTNTKTTKDGATVAKTIDFNEPIKAYTANIIQEAAIKTEVECGDGTTTTTLLTCGFFELLNKHNTFIAHQQVESLMNESVKILNSYLLHDDELIRKAALTTANGDESIANTICELVLGKEIIPEVVFKEGNDVEDSIKITKGYNLNLQLAFGNSTLIDNSNYIIINERVINTDNLVSLLDLIQDPTKPTTFIVKGWDATAALPNGLSPEQINQLKSSLVNVVILDAKIGGSVSEDILGDYHTVLGGKFFKDRYNAPVIIEQQSKLVLKSKGVLVEECNSESWVKDRVSLINAKLEEFTGVDRFSTYAGIVRKRLKTLSNENWEVFIGGETHSDYLERLDRFDDVYLSVVSNIEHGVLPGYNSALLRVADVLKNTNAGNEVFSNNRQLFEDYVKVLQQQSLYLDKELLELTGYTVKDLRSGRQIECSTAKQMGLKAIELGIIDPGYALIAALKGGFKTGKILSKIETVVLSNKYKAVKL